ncbi:MAG: TonB-dependent receptor plug domain-containing protein [Bacteroidia bacterium]|nr:TonB-dependent receptor plug domain-containing protein [Bacteroidia bacterium]
MNLKITLLIVSFLPLGLLAQKQVSGYIYDENGQPLSRATILSESSKDATTTDSLGYFSLRTRSSVLKISHMGYHNQLLSGIHSDTLLEVRMQSSLDILPLVVIREGVDDPVSVTRVSAADMQQTGACILMEGIQQTPGIRSQNQCNVCGTTEIRINGMDGPYTQVLIDGMPIVSGLGSVYAMQSIPVSIIERLEITRGPADAFLGSEAMGGSINIITRQIGNSPRFSIHTGTSSRLENILEASGKFSIRQKVHILLMSSWQQFGLRIDRNKDGFTDIPMYNRLGGAIKVTVPSARSAGLQLFARYVFEDRLGGQMHWTRADRAGDQVYAESIYTSRWEATGKWNLPLKEKVELGFSYVDHRQNSAYGNSFFLASQRNLYSYVQYKKRLGGFTLNPGILLRYNYYDDNTPATQTEENGSFRNNPEKYLQPGGFFTLKYEKRPHWVTSAGLRYEYHPVHKHILSPRVAVKYFLNYDHEISLNAGRGFRAVQIFTEDHSALSGYRNVVFNAQLRPESSWNANLSYKGLIYLKRDAKLRYELSGWYTYFSNKIIADYDSDPNEIRFGNLDGNMHNTGTSLEVCYTFLKGFDLEGSATGNYVRINSSSLQATPLYTPFFSGTYKLSYAIPKTHIDMAFFGQVFSPIRMPMAGTGDPRPAYSPWYQLSHFQASWQWKKRSMEFYLGLRNIFDYLPSRHIDFLIAGAADPFDKNVQTDASGNVVASPGNPYALSFDPSYTYALMSGIQVNVGWRWRID